MIIEVNSEGEVTQETISSISNSIGSVISKHYNSRMLDVNKISWRWVNGEWIGKRSVWTYDFKACWLEETTKENVKSWWCGEEADYTEIFTTKK
jgi:hypothetical protein